MRSAAIPVVAAALMASLAVAATAAARSEPPPSSYPSCGFYWNKNNPPTAAQRRVNACILRARREGRRARAVAVYSTIEGDPIAVYAFVLGKLPVLVVVDATRDAFGPRVWVQRRCERMTVDSGFLTFHDCQNVGRGKPSWLKPVKLPG